MLRSLFREEPILRSGDFLLKLRLWLFSAAMLHVCVAAVVMLPADMASHEDPKIRSYAHLKWRFITGWFNFINICYFPLCIYCDWKEKRREEKKRLVCRLRRVRDIVFTSILFPTILWADYMFWRLYNKDPTLITPRPLFDYVPSWGQHSLHTVSWIVVILDLLLTPRKRPKSVKSRLKVMTAFCVVYCVVILERYLKGEMVYQLLERLSGTEIILFVIMCYVEYLFFFTLQWVVIDWVWGKNCHKEALKVQ